MLYSQAFPSYALSSSQQIYLFQELMLSQQKNQLPMSVNYFLFFLNVDHHFQRLFHRSHFPSSFCPHFYKMRPLPHDSNFKPQWNHLSFQLHHVFRGFDQKMTYPQTQMTTNVVFVKNDLSFSSHLCHQFQIYYLCQHMFKVLV